MATKTWTKPVFGKWSDAINWGGVAPVANDVILIGNTSQVGTIDVTADATLTIASLTMAGNHKANQSSTLTITQPAVLTVTGPINFDGDSFINGSGTLVANGAISGLGTIIASNGGTLDITGTGSITSGVVLDFDASTTAASTLKLDLSGGITSAGVIKMNNTLQVLEIGPSTTLTIGLAETFSNGTVRMKGGTVSDALGITVGKGAAPGNIIGFGTIAADLLGGGQNGQTDTVTASGGTLVLTGGWNAGKAAFIAAVDSIPGSDLEFVGTASLAQPIVINSASQTLEIGALGALTMTGLDIVTNGTIKMDGGKLTDTSGIVIDTGATLIGTGLITAGTALSGDGTVKASGGTLELGSDLSALTPTVFDIDTVAGSVLKVDGAVATGVTLGFLGATGALELADVVGGVLQGFSGKIAGLNVGASATTATNEINIQTPITKAVLTGSTITVLNGATTVGTLALSAAPVHGAYAVVRSDATLGGSDIFLSNEPPVAPAGMTIASASDSGTKGDNVTNVAAPLITGTGVAGDTIALLDGATSVGTATVAAGGTWSIAAATLVEGSNILTAIQSDAFGNVSAASAALNITLDTVAPVLTAALVSDTGGSATDHITRNAALTGTAEAGRTVTISNGSTVLSTATADVDGAWSFTPVGLTDGSYALTASETDVAGNTGSASLAFTLDTTAPAAPGAPDLAAISDNGVSNTDNITNVTTPTFTGTAAPNTTVTLLDGATLNGATVIGSGQADAAGNWSMTTSALAAGVHVIAAKATDLAGNVSLASVPLSVTIDVTAPLAPSTPDLAAASDSGASSTDNITNAIKPNLTGTAEANATITIFDGGIAVGTGQADALGIWSVTTGVLADGVHAITATAIDLAGNPSVASAALSVTIDSVAPGGPGIAQVSAVAISGTAEANSAFALFDGLTQIGTASASGAGAWSIPIALAAGTHALTGTATDLVGNVSAPSAVLTAVIGTPGNDVLAGGPGAVIMLGGTGNDAYIVDSSANVVTEKVGEGVDKVSASASYTLAADSEIEILTGSGSAALTLAGNEFANTITGGTGSDTLTGGGGNDTFVATIGDGNDGYDGGTGTDTYDLSQTSAAATVSLAAGTAASLQTGNDTLVAIENVIGSSGSDSIAGDASSNNLSGGAGNDALDGGAGADTMTGGTGNDTYTVDNAADVVVEAGGQGTDTVNASVSYSLAAGSEIENLTARVATGLSLAGNEFNNTITGGGGNDTLTGGLGNDRFVATVGDGSDAYDGGLGTDTYDLSGTTAGAIVNLGLGTSTSADTGTDTVTAIENVVGSAGNDIFVASVGDGNNSYNGGAGTDTYDLSATTANATVNLAQGTASSLDIGTDTLTLNSIENVTGGAGNDTLVGDARNNVLIGGAGNDTLNGNAGADTMLGGLGNDSYVVDNAGDVVTEAVGQGSDTVFATASYALAAGSEVETMRVNVATGLTLTGNEFSNTIIGNAGNDTLFGGAGNDVLSGLAGADTMAGGTGNDTYTVDNAADVANEVVGQGTDTVNTSVSYTLSAGSEVENLTASVATGLSLTGNEFNNTITGGAGNDTLTGGAGNDRFVATVGDGNDTHDGGLGVDTYDLSGTTAGATVNLGLGTSTSAATGTDTLTAIENVVGSAGNDIFVASVGDGNNSYNGGAGTDTYDLSATGANATVNLAQGTASSLDIGTDTFTPNSIENLTGGAGNDTLVGDARNAS
jgi:large repetitive protein